MLQGILKTTMKNDKLDIKLKPTEISDLDYLFQFQFKSVNKTWYSGYEIIVSEVLKFKSDGGL
jgi:hypothetical protein